MLESVRQVYSTRDYTAQDRINLTAAVAIRHLWRGGLNREQACMKERQALWTVPIPDFSTQLSLAYIIMGRSLAFRGYLGEGDIRGEARLVLGELGVNPADRKAIAGISQQALLFAVEDRILSLPSPLRPSI